MKKIISLLILSFIININGYSQIITIGTGTSAQSYIPLHGDYDYGWSTMIYDQAEINLAGDITAIAFYVNNSPSSYATNNQTVYMTHIASSTFADGIQPNSGAMTQVFSGDITWNGTGWATIVLDIPFSYNNSDNLQIYWENNDGSYVSGYPTFNYTSTSSDYKAIYKYQDGSFPTTAGTRTYNRPNIQLSIPVLYDMTDGITVTTCGGIFYDPQGTAGYTDNSGAITETFCSGSSERIKFDFTVFETNESVDNLVIYDGPDTGSPVIGTYSGTTSPGVVTSLGTCLTFAWNTDSNQDGDPGWEATISCIPPACLTTISSFSHTESFETDLGDWTQETTDDFDWTRQSGSTSSTSTGPPSASDGSYYLYTEASSQTNSEFIINSPCYDLSSCAEPHFYFDYHMSGVAMGSLDLEVEAIPGSGTWTSVWSMSGDQGNEWHSTYVDLTAYVGTTIKLRFKGVTGADITSDMAIDNIEFSCSPPVVCPTTISSFPYTESFESGFGDWDQTSLLIIDDYDWTRQSGSTSSSSTGPPSASDGSYYLYTESSSQYNADFIIHGPCYDFSSCAEPHFYFDYHMYGATIGSLDLEVEATPGSDTWISVWSLSGDQGNAWYSTFVDLTAYAGTTIKLRFKGVTGSSSTSDMAIDNIEFSCSPPPVCPTTISSFPYTESFESGFGDWIQTSFFIADDYDWTRQSGSTSSTLTGPPSASDGSWYLYTESSSQYNADFIIHSPCYDLSSCAEPHFYFDYHMYGATMGSLDLEVEASPGSDTWISVWSLSGDQGNAWYSTFVDLTAYAGTTIKLRFKGVTGTSSTGDMAIDNIEFTCSPPPVCLTTISSFPYSESFESDFGDWVQTSYFITDDYDWTRKSGTTPTSSTGPPSASDGSWYLFTESTSQYNSDFIIHGPCYDLSSCTEPHFYFDYHMYGATMGSLDLEVEATPGSDIWVSVWSLSGDQGNSWHSTYVDLTAYAGATIKLRFKGVTGTSSTGDMAIDNIEFTCSPPPVCLATISSYPYSESFESDFGDWVQTSYFITDDYDWTRDQSGTPTGSTGPTSGSDGTWYLFTESTSQYNSDFIIHGPCFDITCANPLFDFDYHMYGSGMGSLDLEVETTPGSGTWTSIWSLSGDQTDAWHTASINLVAYIGTTIKLRFVGVTGATGYGDMAIDNIQLYCPCTPPADPANPTASNNTCGDKDLFFAGSPGLGLTWYWQANSAGTDMTNSSSPYAVSFSGTYYLKTYKASTSCWSNAVSITVEVEHTPAQPSINDTTVCPGDITLAAYGSDCAEYNWYDAPSGGTLLNTGINYDLTISATNTYYVEASSPGNFDVTFESTNSYIVNHLAASGDDRSGIAITPNYLYVVGDVNTARMDLPLSLLTATLLPIKDGLFSDLSTGDLWTIYNGTAEPNGTALSGYNVNSLMQYDDNLVFNGTSLSLSSSFTVGYEGGMYAGKGFVIIQDGDTDNFYHIDLLSGIVTSLGIITTPSRTSGEGWATWGIAEYDGCSYYVLYTSEATDDIIRLDLSSGLESTAADFTDIGNMTNITASPWENRWYFHHEGTSQWTATNSEMAGYCDATISSTAGGNCTSSRDEFIVNVQPVPTAPNLSAYPSILPEGGSSTLTGSYSSGTLNWYNECGGTIFATGSTVVVNPTVTSNYIAAVDNGSCISECDTVVVIVAHPCTIEATADGLLDTLNICAGDVVDLLATGGCSFLMESNFDGGLGVGWSSNASPQFDNPCVAPIDGTYLWIGSAATFPRDLITESYSVTNECQICFDFVMATQGGSSPCEGPDEVDEGISLQWSIDNEITWTDITYFSPDGCQYPSNIWVGEGSSVNENCSSDFVSWENYCFNIPAGASSNETKFRFHQEQVTSTVNDHWGLDNVEIICPSNDPVIWSHGPTELNPADIIPGASATYTVIIDDGLGFDNADTAQVYINIIGTPNVTDDHACSVAENITMTASGTGTLEWYDHPTAGVLVNTGATYTIPATSAPVTFYVEEVLPSFTTINYTFDSDMELWSASHTCSGTADWAYNSDGGVGTLFALDPTTNSAQLVQSPSIDVSGWSSSLTLSYNHRYSTEDCCDEGIVAYRLNGGAWIHFIPTAGSYGSANAINSNPINGCSDNTLASYHGSQAAYTIHSGSIDVSTANTLEIAFIFTSDGSVGSTGWFIDEVNIEGGGSSACPDARAEVHAEVSDLNTNFDTEDVSCYGLNDGEVYTTIVDGSNSIVPGLFTYNWETGNTTPLITNMSAGDYDVTITDAFGCDVNSTLTILGPALPNLIVNTSGISGECNIVSPDEWVYIVNETNSDELIASVFDAAGGNDLYMTEAEATIYGAVQYYNTQPYLQRVIRVTPGVQGPATVRIYFTNAEFVALQAADPTITSIGQLAVTKCDDAGVWQNCSLIPSSFHNSPIGTGTNYYAEVSVTSFSKFYIHKNTGWPLPVELIDFTAHCSHNGVKLNWSTSSETNNDYFIIEKSMDMKSFEYVAELSGKGNSNNENKYLFEDFNSTPQKTYYRLLQVDFDGKAEYHPAIVSDCSDLLASDIKALQNINKDLLVRVDIPIGPYQLSVFDNVGKLITNKQIIVEAKPQEYLFSNTLFISGLYLVLVQNQNNKYTKKVIMK